MLFSYLTTVAPIDFVPIVVLRIMRSSDHNTCSSMSIDYTKRLEKIINIRNFLNDKIQKFLKTCTYYVRSSNHTIE